MRARVKQVTYWLLICGILSTLTAGCGLFSKNDSGTPGTQAGVCSVDDPGFRDSFKNTLHPSLQKACYECHNSQSPKAPSPFADDSPSVAMEAAKRFADFNNPSSSVLVKRMEQGHNCGGSCGGLAAEFTEKIAQWKSQLGGSVGKLNEDCSGLKDQDDARIIKTSAIHIDPSIGTAGKTLVFDLKDASPPLPGAAFQIRIRQFTPAGSGNNGSYILDRPVFATQPLTGNTEQNARVANIHILRNGTEDPLYRNFVSTDFILQPRPFPQGTQIFGWYIIKDSSQIINWASSAGEDISFELKVSVTNLLWSIPKTDPFRCNRVDLFANFYEAKKNVCLDCHDSGGNAYAYFPMKASTDAEVCRNFKMRSNPLDSDIPNLGNGNPDTSQWTSLFYLMSQDKVAGYRHPVSVTYTTNEEISIRNWLAQEK